MLEARHGAEGVRQLDLFLDRAGIEIVPVNAEHALEARRAFGRFGKGRHEAGLNFGDCFSYALAIISGEALLFKGAMDEGVPIQVALGKVIRAMGVKEFAGKVRMPKPNVLRAIRPRHNPTQATLNRLLKPFRLKLSLARLADRRHALPEKKY